MSIEKIKVVFLLCLLFLSLFTFFTPTSIAYTTYHTPYDCSYEMVTGNILNTEESGDPANCIDGVWDYINSYDIEAYTADITYNLVFPCNLTKVSGFKLRAQTDQAGNLAQIVAVKVENDTGVMVDLYNLYSDSLMVGGTNVVDYYYNFSERNITSWGAVYNCSGPYFKNLSLYISHYFTSQTGTMIYYEFAWKGDELSDVVYVDDDASSGWYDATHVHTIQEGVTNCTSGGKIYVWDGTYTGENIYINKPVTIIGNGTDAVHLHYQDTVTGDNSLIYLVSNNITMSGIHFNGTEDNTNQIINNDGSSRNCSNLHIYDCSFTNTSDTPTREAIYLEYDYLRNVNISNCTFTDCYYCIGICTCDNITIHNNTIANAVIGLYLDDTNNGDIYGNLIQNVTDYGIYIITEEETCGNSFSIENNTLDCIGSGGIVLYQITNVTFNNNSINGIGGDGVFIESTSEYIYLSNNTITNTTYHGIYIEDSNHVYINNSTIRPNLDGGQSAKYDGIYIDNTCNDITIYNTIISETNGDGVFITNGINTVEDCNINNCSAIAIYLGKNVYNSTITGCTIRDNDIGINIKDARDNLIYNNYFSNTLNAVDTGTDNIWNTTKTLGTNIIYGPYLGGNYWHDYTGADNDNDSLGDTLTPYNSSGSISTGGDYHPLVGWYVGPPENMTSGFNSTYVSFNSTWDWGTNADQTVVIRNNNSYPSGPTDGYIVQNSTSLSYNTSISTNDHFYLTAFSYNTTWNKYSTGVNMPWGGIQFQVFNESNPSQGLTFDLEISNAEGSTPVVKEIDKTNGFQISVDDMPSGTNLAFIISSDGYKTRTYYKDREYNQLFNYSFFLPPNWSPQDEDTDIPPDELVLTSHTDTCAVTDYTNDTNITLDHDPEEITAVYIYNSSIYGGWVPVAEDYYSYDSTSLNVTVNASVLDVNSSLIRVDYTTYETRGVLETEAYLIHVIDEVGNPVEDAKIVVKRYMNTTEIYEEVSSMLTDGNGDVVIYLIPGVYYKINISKTGYDSTSSDWLPTSVVLTKTFMIKSTRSDITDEYIYSNVITFTASLNSNNTILITYDDNLEETSSAGFCVYANSTHTLISCYNTTGTDSLTHYFTGINTTYDYQVVLTLDHESFGVQTDIRYLQALDTGLTNNTDFNTNFDILGSNPFGWSSFIGFLVLVAGVFSFGRRNSGISLMVTGGVMLFLEYIIGLTLIGSTLGILFIVIGVLIQWRNQRKEVRV